MLRIAHLLIVADAALLRASHRDATPDFVSHVPAKDLFDKCVKIASVGLGSPQSAGPVCNREIGEPGVCSFLAEQIAIYSAVHTAKDEEPVAGAFCGLVVQLSSANSKTDLMEYVSGLERWEVCVNSILAALDNKADTPQAAIEANAEATCKMELEQVFERDHYPTQLSGAACTKFIAEVNNALASGALDPDDGGQTFCNCAEEPCKVERPMRQSQVCDHPVGFPMQESDIPAGAADAVKEAKELAATGKAAGASGVAPVLSMEQFIGMAKSAYGTGHIAFLTADKDGDGKLSPEEWDDLCVALGLEPEDCRHLFKEMDANGDGAVDAMEFSDAFGVTLEGLRQRLLAKHGNADEGWKAADTDGNGELTPAEFFKHCVDVDVSTANAGKLFPQVDTDGNGKISPEEYKNAFGVTMDELKARARDKFGPPSESFPAFDKDGDGEISPEEWEAACEELGISKEKAAELLKEADQDGDGKVSEDEFRASMGMGLEDLQREVFDKLGSYEDALKALDKDGDGEISEEEFKEGLKAQGFGDKEIDEMYEELAGEDGKITEEDFKKATGADELEKLREEAGLGKKELAAGAVDVKALPVGAEADADGDGVVSKDEYLDACKAKGIAPEDAEIAWAQADKDGDGKASVADVDAAAEAAEKAAEAFAAADTDGDGKVSEEEFLEHAREQGIPEEEALKAYEKLDKDGNGELSPEEFIYGGGLDGALEAEGGSATPPPTDVPGVPLDEVSKRVHDAFGETSDAWEAIAGSKDANHMTPEQWEEQAAKLGLSPEQAAEAYKKMDKNGDGKVDFEEFQEAMGVSLDDLKKRMLEKHGNGEKALEATDTDKDGKVSEAELLKAAMDVGVPEAQARKIWQEHLDKDKDGFMTGEEFLDLFGVDADILRERMADAGYNDAGEAFKDMDADGSGEVSEEEFVKAAMEKMGVSEAEAKKMFKEADADGSGGLSEAEFRTAFGVGPDELREACFEHFKDPKLAFHAMDKDGDEVLTAEEWEKGLAQMGFNTGQAKHLFKLADTNRGETTHGVLSRFEFWTFLRYRPHHPHFMYYWGKYYGDLDRWGYAHQHHNELTHEMLEPKKSFLATWMP